MIKNLKVLLLPTCFPTSVMWSSKFNVYITKNSTLHVYQDKINKSAKRGDAVMGYCYHQINFHKAADDGFLFYHMYLINDTEHKEKDNNAYYYVTDGINQLPYGQIIRGFDMDDIRPTDQQIEATTDRSLLYSNYIREIDFRQWIDEHNPEFVNVETMIDERPQISDPYNRGFLTSNPDFGKEFMLMSYGTVDHNNHIKISW